MPYIKKEENYYIKTTESDGSLLVPLKLCIKRGTSQKIKSYEMIPGEIAFDKDNHSLRVNYNSENTTFENLESCNLYVKIKDFDTNTSNKHPLLASTYYVNDPGTKDAGSAKKIDSIYIIPKENRIYASSFQANDTTGFRVSKTLDEVTFNVGLIIGDTSKNKGLYDIGLDKWIVYSDQNGNVILNGKANSATNAESATNSSKISQIMSTTTAYRPILSADNYLSDTTINDTIYGSVYKNSKIGIQPSTGNLKTDGALEINENGNALALSVGRNSYNYFRATKEGGSFAFVANGKSVDLNNSSFVITGDSILPGKNKTYTIGNSTYRWNEIYATKIISNDTGAQWVKGRDYATIKKDTYGSDKFCSILSCKTSTHTWDVGIYGENFYFVYASDANYNSNTNETNKYYITPDGYFSGSCETSNTTKQLNTDAINQVKTIKINNATNADNWNGFSSGNGYMKFGSYKICWGTLTATYACTTLANGHYNGNSTNITNGTFASGFSSAPIVLLSGTATTGIINIEPNTVTTSGITSIRFHRTTNYTDTTGYKINYIAIGQA